MAATAPSGGTIELRKFSDADRELSFYCGKLTATEEGQCWRAKLHAERPGVHRWLAARSLLENHGWTITAFEVDGAE